MPRAFDGMIENDRRLEAVVDWATSDPLYRSGVLIAHSLVCWYDPPNANMFAATYTPSCQIPAFG